MWTIASPTHGIVFGNINISTPESILTERAYPFPMSSCLCCRVLFVPSIDNYQWNINSWTVVFQNSYPVNVVACAILIAGFILIFFLMYWNNLYKPVVDWLSKLILLCSLLVKPKGSVWNIFWKHSGDRVRCKIVAWINNTTWRWL